MTTTQAVTESQAAVLDEVESKPEQVVQESVPTQDSTVSVEADTSGESGEQEVFTPKDGPFRSHEYKRIPLDLIQPDPNKARILVNTFIKVAITTGIKNLGGLAEEYAILVRKLDEGFQIIDGHLRFMVAQELNLTEIPAIVVEMDDEESMIAQVTRNTQHPLTSLEIGIRLVRFVEKNSGGTGNKGGQKEYAPIFGKSQETLSHARAAANVYLDFINTNEGKKTIETSTEFFLNRMEHIYQISRADNKFHLALMKQMKEKDWTVAEVKDIVRCTKELKETVFENWDDNTILEKIKAFDTTINNQKVDTHNKRIVTQLDKFTPVKDKPRSEFKETVKKIIPVYLGVDQEADFKEALEEHIQHCQEIVNPQS